jgi:hypothetical protein
MLSVLVEEHDEDIARLGGFLSSTESARNAAEEPVGRRFGGGGHRGDRRRVAGRCASGAPDGWWRLR